MDKSDLDRLWQFPWFDREVRAHYQLDRRRHLRWDANTRTVYYIARRSVRRNGSVGRFAVDEQTLQWLLAVERRGQVEDAAVVLVEDWKDPPRVVHGASARWLWERLERIVPWQGSDGSGYWWLDDSFEPIDAWLGPVLKVPPF